MSSYDKVRGGKLVLKGGLSVSKGKIKKGKKKAASKAAEGDATKEEETEIDTGIGFAPSGQKKTAKYEEMFPEEAQKLGYTSLGKGNREAALDERAAKRADRYCK
jgi:hypothetical protein